MSGHIPAFFIEVVSNTCNFIKHIFISIHNLLMPPVYWDFSVMGCYTEIIYKRMPEIRMIILLSYMYMQI